MVTGASQLNGTLNVVGVVSTAAGIQDNGPLNLLSASSPLEFNGASGLTGQVLISGGAGTPSWTSTPTAISIGFNQLTAGVAIGGAMIVGAGASLDYSGGTINASTLNGGS
jgi:hypothetical protein